MNILALLLDWFLHFDQKLLIVPNAITNFFNGILLAFVNISSSVGNAIASFINLLTNNIKEQGNALGNYFTNLGNSIVKAWNWTVKTSKDLVIYATKLYGWAAVTGFNWLSQFFIALIALSIEFLKDFGNAFMESSLSAIPRAITNVIFSITGFNFLPAVGEIKKGIEKAMKELFKVGGSLNPGVDFTSAITGELNKAAKAVEKGVKDFFGL